MYVPCVVLHLQEQYYNYNDDFKYHRRFPETSNRKQAENSVKRQASLKNELNKQYLNS
jgi:hypothetical protein